MPRSNSLLTGESLCPTIFDVPDVLLEIKASLERLAETAGDLQKAELLLNAARAKAAHGQILASVEKLEAVI